MSDKTLFLDLETTGLNPKFCSVLEVAAAVVDGDLQVVDTHEAVVFHPDSKIFPEMDDWCRRTHSASGLLDEVARSPFSLQQVDEALAEFIKRSFNVLAGRVEIAGNSVHFDLDFIRHHMPRTAALLHYRIQDVSGWARGLRRWCGVDVPSPALDVTHRAMPDVKHSLEQARIIRSVVQGRKA